MQTHRTDELTDNQLSQTVASPGLPEGGQHPQALIQ